MSTKTTCLKSHGWTEKPDAPHFFCQGLFSHSTLIFFRLRAWLEHFMSDGRKARLTQLRPPVFPREQWHPGPGDPTVGSHRWCRESGEELTCPAARSLGVGGLHPCTLPSTVSSSWLVVGANACPSRYCPGEAGISVPFASAPSAYNAPSQSKESLFIL